MTNLQLVTNEVIAAFSPFSIDIEKQYEFFKIFCPSIERYPEFIPPGDFVYAFPNTELDNVIKNLESLFGPMDFTFDYDFTIDCIWQISDTAFRIVVSKDLENSKTSIYAYNMDWKQ